MQKPWVQLIRDAESAEEAGQYDRAQELRTQANRQEEDEATEWYWASYYE